MQIKKIDIINGAYSQLRISGLTTTPSAEDITLALDRLESMMEEFFARNVCVGYNFEDIPDANSLSGLEQRFKHAIETNLASRLMPDFGKNDPLLQQKASGQFSFLSSQTAQIPETQYPERMPIGSGNTKRWARYTRYFRPIEEAPTSCETKTMLIGEINNFVESFESYLQSGETLSSYVLEADTGLTILSQSLSSPLVNYQVRADGNGENVDSVLQVKITGTTSSGRKEIRIINFNLKSSQI